MLSKPQRRFSRRDFLSFMSLNALNAAVAVTGLPAPVFAFSQTTDDAGLNKPDLGFADRHGLGPDMDAPNVESFCCPLHEEKLLPAASVDEKTRQAVKQILKTQFANANLHWRDDYRVGFTYQHYGVPDNSAQTDTLLKYCNHAGDFAQTKLKDMFNAGITWEQLTHEKSVIGVPAFHGFVGRYTYYVTRAVVLDDDTDRDLPYLVQALPVERAIHYIVAGKTAVPKRGTLYIIPGTTSLVAPFSELLHLTFHEPSLRYAAELSASLREDQAQEQARIAGETVNEAAAIVLASEFMHHLDCSERIATINFMANDLSDTYGYLPKAIAFMKRAGVQNAVDIYFDNPAKFMTRIDKV